jgi:hypothetical protein
MMTSTAVFVGTSLSHDEARAILPSADYYPPIARGDLPRTVEAGARVVAIIDGVFHQSFPVTPTEIKSALAKNVRIYGASSMGALRAAEMHPLGMIGVGLIYEWYRSGVVSADDEVGLVFDPETGRPLTVPLVNMRYSFQRAAENGVIDSETAKKLLETAKTIHYTELTYSRIFARTGPDILPPGFTVASFSGYLQGFDLKREDAMACLHEVRRFLDKMGS